MSLSCLSLRGILLLVDTQSRTCKIGASGGSSCAKLCSPGPRLNEPCLVSVACGSPSCTHDASHCPSDGVLLEWTPVWCGVIGPPFTLACSHWRVHPSSIFDALSYGSCRMCSLPAVGGALLHSLAWHPRVAFPRFQLSAHALV